MSHHKKRILFICKQGGYGAVGDEPTYSYSKKFSGLYNSTHFIVKGLKRHHIHAEIVIVNDNNDIDREVALHRPDIVVIEALWVVPDKFDKLKQLHPNVAWYIHLHSDIPFLAQEGIAIEWITACAAKGIGIITNCKDTFESLETIIDDDQLVYLANVYLNEPRRSPLGDNPILDIACFGAIRPLKNQLLQALAAIQFATEKDRPLRFHINSGRVEGGGQPVLKNLQILFNLTANVQLVEHDWLEPNDFLNFLQYHVDIGMQCSLSETFNVVSADYVTAGIPIVVSNQVKWVSKFCQAKSDSLPDIVSKMHRVYRNQPLCRYNQFLLDCFARKALREWVEFVQG